MTGGRKRELSMTGRGRRRSVVTGSVVSMRTRMRIRIQIQGAKPMRIRSWPNFQVTKVKFLHEKYRYLKKVHIYEDTKALLKGRKQGLLYLQILVNFHIPGSESRTLK